MSEVGHSVDVVQLVTDPWSDADLDRLAELERAQSALEAERATVLARMNAATDARELGWAGRAPWASLLLEVAGTCRVSQVTAGSRLDDATHLVERLPGTHAAFAAGALYAPQVRVLVQETRDASPEVCAEVERRVLPAAAQLAPADLRRRVQRAVLSADPATAHERHEHAAEQRRTWVRPDKDGMAVQGAVLTAVQGRRFDADLTALLGRTTTSRDDSRTADQRRSRPPRRPARPHARAARPARRRPATARHAERRRPLGADRANTGRCRTRPAPSPQDAGRRQSARLRRDGPEPRAGVARRPRLDHRRPRPHAALRRRAPQGLPRRRHRTPAGPRRRGRVLSDAARAAAHVATPTVVGDDDPSRLVHSQHDPTDAQRELVDLRDEGCDGIGCNVPASASDLDHHVPWPSGPTTASNLRARSERCHGAKHSGWTVTVDEHGVSTWTSPRGRQYVRLPRYEPPPQVCRPSTVRLRRLRLASARSRDDVPAA